MLFFSIQFFYGYILVLGVMEIFVKCAPNKLDSSWDTREEPKLGDIYLTDPPESEEKTPEDGREASETTTAESMAPDEYVLTGAHKIPTESFEEIGYSTEDTTTLYSSSVTLSWAELFMILQKKAFPSEAKTLHEKGLASQQSHTSSSIRDSIPSTEVLNEVQTIVDNLLKYNRETGEQLVKLKKVLYESNSNGKKSPRIKIKINAQAPLHIRTEYVNGKNVIGKGIISVLNKDKDSNEQTVTRKEKSEKQETIIGPPLEQETEGEIEKARKLFIKKGANFLRHAWNRYLTQKLKHSLQNQELENDE